MRADTEISDGKKGKYYIIYDVYGISYRIWNIQWFFNPFSRLFGWSNLYKRWIQFQNAAMVWSTGDGTAGFHTKMDF